MDDSPATALNNSSASPQPLDTSNQPLDTNVSQSLPNQSTFDTALEDIVKATIFDDSPVTTLKDSPASLQSLTTSSQTLATTSEPNVNTSVGETRFNECQASFISYQPTSQKSPESISSSHVFGDLHPIFCSQASSYIPSEVIKPDQPQMPTASYRQILPKIDNNLHQQPLTIYMTSAAQHQSSIQYNLRTRASLTKTAIQLMEQWYHSHLDHPYPSPIIVEELARRGNIKEKQVRKWFINKRSRNKQSSGISKKKMSSVNSCKPSVL